MLQTLTIVAGILVCAAPARAQGETWNWQIRITSTAAQPADTHSRLALTPDAIVLESFTHVGVRDLRIESCRVPLGDLETVRTVAMAPRSFLFAQLKSKRTVACLSGTRSFASIPIVDDAASRDALVAVQRVCCTVAANVRATPVPSTARPNVVATLRSSVTPHAHSSPALDVVDWVESAGVFSFIRARNRGAQTIVLTSGDVENCRNVVIGCGAFIDRARSIAPRSVAILATVIAGTASDAPAFSYRYTARADSVRVDATGWANKAPSGWGPPLGARQLRSAEALAMTHFAPPAGANALLAGARSLATASPQPDAKPRLTHRGTSRLAIGMSGSAVVRVSIGENGTPEGATIVSVSNRRLIPAAIETAISSSFAPAIHAGRPIAAVFVTAFQFDGDDPALSSIPVWNRAPVAAPSDGR